MNLFTRNSPYYHLLNYLLFLLKHPVFLFSYRRSGTICRSQLPGQICCPETSVDSYQRTLGSIPEGQRPPAHRGGSLQSPIFMFICRRERQKSLNWDEASNPPHWEHVKKIRSGNNYSGGENYGTWNTWAFRMWTRVEMWWHTVTHGRGSEGETDEWSG